MVGRSRTHGDVIMAKAPCKIRCSLIRRNAKVLLNFYAKYHGFQVKDEKLKILDDRQALMKDLANLLISVPEEHQAQFVKHLYESLGLNDQNSTIVSKFVTNFEGEERIKMFDFTFRFLITLRDLRGTEFFIKRARNWWPNSHTAYLPTDLVLKPHQLDSIIKPAQKKTLSDFVNTITTALAKLKRDQREAGLEVFNKVWRKAHDTLCAYGDSC